MPQSTRRGRRPTITTRWSSPPSGRCAATFRDVDFAYFGRTTRFSKSGARFQVTTENEQGEQETFAVAYTLGIAPLQQYLVAFDDGRIQALPFAWDTRPAQAGGQRWFHLYTSEDVTPKSPLFWTRPQQNWNHMCGECHTTDFKKGFSSAEQRFDSRFNELGNGCESCHGAGGKHVAANQLARATHDASRVDRSLLGLRELERATEIAPANSHYAYVLAVGLHHTQQVDRALATLRTAAQRFPENAEIRSALRAYGGP